jgi:hypothetical protein
MRAVVPVLLCLLAACTLHRKDKHMVYRPLEVGTYRGYTIAPCDGGGHVVRLAKEPDERGEANSRERVDNYKKSYIVPALVDITIKGWGYESKCAHSGLSLHTPAKEQGEVLDRIGEVLVKNPTDIEVHVIPQD